MNPPDIDYVIGLGAIKKVIAHYGIKYYHFEYDNLGFAQFYLHKDFKYLEECKKFLYERTPIIISVEFYILNLN